MDFSKIVPRYGGQHEAFEEFCCQLARRSIKNDQTFVRLHGKGGDGGVECFADLPDEMRIGWQAKYVFKVEALLGQADRSIETALKIHPALGKYILCFPFDLTGPTSRPGRSGLEKFESWREEKIRYAEKNGRSLEIEAWSASKLSSLLMDLDASGGIHTFFFNEKILTPEWFDRHANEAFNIAGPRYTPELNVLTEVEEWFAAFGRTPAWFQKIDTLPKELRKKHKQFNQELSRDQSSLSPRWPSDILDDGKHASDGVTSILEIFNSIRNDKKIPDYGDILNRLNDTHAKLESLEYALAKNLEDKKKVDSPGYRQFMAEYTCSFPMANLDVTREMREKLSELRDWFGSPAGSLAFWPAFVLSGAWGVGKTHTVCDVVRQRLKEDLLSCAVFGHKFDGQPDFWTRLAEHLGLPSALGKDNLLGTLNAAAEGSGQSLILFVDAINETGPVRYWKDRLRPIVSEIARWSNLRVCFTCRTPYLDHCLRKSDGLIVAEHPGFKNVTHTAIADFFKYYGLKPPVSPILQAEFRNPLYLRLACETLMSRGEDRFPLGWGTSQSIISAFLTRKEEEFFEYTGVSKNAHIVTSGLRHIAFDMAESGESKLSRSRAVQVIKDIWSPDRAHEMVDWLINENLLVEEVSDSADILNAQSTVRLAFERLGDFLIAEHLLSEFDAEAPIDSVFEASERFRSLVQSTDAVAENYGVLSALSILIPEKYSGRELSSLDTPYEIRSALLEIVVGAIPWRDTDSFSDATGDVLTEALHNQDLMPMALDSLLSVSWRPSAIDSIWFHEFINDFPLSKRDAGWCGYLHESYEDSGPVKRLIDAAFEMHLEDLDKDIAERWAIALLWFTAAADRRVKSWAARALTKVLVACPDAIPNLLVKCIYFDDDEVREHLLLTSYGALINSRNADVAGRSAKIVLEEFSKSPCVFNNALLRDHIRCIGELARELETLPEGYDPELVMQPIDSEWPLKIPEDDEVKKWGKSLFKPNEFASDFYKYSMYCLECWTHGLAKENMGKWILQRIAQDFGYFEFGRNYYDEYMLSMYGGGRGKPVWAERIGKKYQWVAMYQLASRLHDHIDRKQRAGEPEPSRTPLILLEERKFDPTLSVSQKAEKQIDPWWAVASADMDSTGQLSDEDWVAREDDIPEMESLLSTIEHDEQNWRMLMAYLSWGQSGEDEDWNALYRDTWAHIFSYLVREEDMGAALACIRHRNFYGRWMPESAGWPYGFAGEYSWATPFNTEPEEWYGIGGHKYELPVKFQPTWDTLIVEWEYDPPVALYGSLLVPNRRFFSLGDLWWNGRNGYRVIGEKTVFQCLQAKQAAAKTLVGDANDLFDRLSRLKLRLIWTMLGEKLIAGAHPDIQRPRRTFSQVAYLGEDNSVHTEKRMFFDDYEQDAKPRPIEDN